MTMGMILNRSFPEMEPTSAATGALPLTPLAVAPIEWATWVDGRADGRDGRGRRGAGRRAGPQRRLELDGPPVSADELGRALVGAVGGRGTRRSRPGGRPGAGPPAPRWASWAWASARAAAELIGSRWGRGPRSPTENNPEPDRSRWTVPSSAGARSTPRSGSRKSTVVESDSAGREVGGEDGLAPARVRGGRRGLVAEAGGGVGQHGHGKPTEDDQADDQGEHRSAHHLGRRYAPMSRPCAGPPGGYAARTRCDPARPAGRAAASDWPGGPRRCRWPGPVRVPGRGRRWPPPRWPGPR